MAGRPHPPLLCRSSALWCQGQKPLSNSFSLYVPCDKVMPTVHLLDYVAGNVRSLVNAIEKLGYSVEWIRTPEDVDNAEVCSI